MIKKLLILLLVLQSAACGTSATTGSTDAISMQDATPTDASQLPPDLCRNDCILAGFCTFDPVVQHCTIASDDDCRRGWSTCELSGLCYFDPATKACFASSKEGCADTWGCKLAGLCHAEGPICQPLTQQDCQQSYRCKKYGHCTLHKWHVNGIDYGECKVGSNADCANSIQCQSVGRCTYSPGNPWCIASSAAQCAASTGCAEYGACALGADVTSDKLWTDECLKPPSTDCATTKACTMKGSCINGGYWCQHAKPLDCSQTGVCKEKGWCKANIRYDECMADDNPFPYPYTYELLP